MTDKEFEKRMAALRRRLQLLELARTGAADTVRVDVKSYTVRAHKVRAHQRVLYRLRSEEKKR